jgi:hypothetical protein
MSRLILTSALIARFKQRCDMVGDDSIDRAEWLSYASEVYGEMGLEVSFLLPRAFETSTSIPATGATSYSAPAAHHITLRVVEVLTDGSERPLRELQEHEDHDYRGRVGTAVGWIHQGGSLYLCPAPASGTYKWYYASQPADLSANVDADNIDVLCPAGEAFLIWGVAVLAKAKGGKDVQLAMAQRERARDQLQVWASNQNLTDVRTRGPIADDDGAIRLPTWELP